MSSAIQNILQGALGDGARASKFDVLLAFSNTSLYDQQTASTLVKSTSFPGKSHTIIDFKYKGRSLPIKGQTKYSQTWECSFYLTQDHGLKAAIETWMEALDQQHNYLTDKEDKNMDVVQKTHNQNKYTTTVTLYQLNFDGDQKTTAYELFNVFPIEITPIQYSSESAGQVQEFSVTFAYSHFAIRNVVGTEGNFVDEIAGGLLAAAKNSIQNAVDTAQNTVGNFINNMIGDTLNSLNKKYSNFAESAGEGGVTNAVSSIINGGTNPRKLKDKRFMY